MDHFQRQGPALYADAVPLREVAARFGTPTYVYTAATVRRHVRVLQEAMRTLDHHICYAIKANGNLALLELVRAQGCGFDAGSLGELARALMAGAPPEQIVLSGVGKRDDEIDAAIRVGVMYIGVESAAELHAVSSRAVALGRTARVAVRVNPHIDAKTHPHIATGLRDSKFGVAWDEAPAVIATARVLPGVSLVGVTCHIGSQLVELGPFAAAATRLADLVTELSAPGVRLTYVGMGGGLGIPYHHETPPSPEEYGRELVRVLAPLGLTLVLEPGRVIIGNAGVLLTRVVRVRPGAARPIAIVDAGMNDLLRPALYAAYHAVEVVELRPGAAHEVDIAGPVCESADILARARALSPFAPGDLIAIRGAGAYGFAMASSYNGRPRPAEVLCDGERALVIRDRETLAQLWQGERHLDGRAAADELPEALNLP